MRAGSGLGDPPAESRRTTPAAAGLCTGLPPDHSLSDSGESACKDGEFALHDGDSAISGDMARRSPVGVPARGPAASERGCALCTPSAPGRPAGGATDGEPRPPGSACTTPVSIGGRNCANEASGRSTSLEKEGRCATD